MSILIITLSKITPNCAKNNTIVTINFKINGPVMKANNSQIVQNKILKNRVVLRASSERQCIYTFSLKEKKVHTY